VIRVCSFAAHTANDGTLRSRSIPRQSLPAGRQAGGFNDHDTTNRPCLLLHRLPFHFLTGGAGGLPRPLRTSRPSGPAAVRRACSSRRAIAHAAFVPPGSAGGFGQWHARAQANGAMLPRCLRKHVGALARVKACLFLFLVVS